MTKEAPVVKKYPGYPIRYVAFLDVLGFADLVKSAESDEAAFRRAGAILRISEKASFKTMIAEAEEKGGFVDYTAFSDSIVVSSNHLLPVARIAHAIWGAALSWTLMSIRGAIARGTIYHRGAVVFGQGMVDAYRLESSVARFPRIIFADDIDVSQIAGHVRVATDRDGFRYIAPFEPSDVSLEQESLALRGPLRRAVVQGLGNGHPDVVAKWRWLVDEFNRRAVEEHERTGDDTDRISIEEIKSNREDLPNDDFAEFDWFKVDD